MGQDLMGVSPKFEKGEYFRNTIDQWQDLWRTIAETSEDILSPEELSCGRYNDGCYISERKALLIAKRLREYLSDFEKKDIGEGRFVKHYPIDDENITQFITFAINSRGFKI